MTVAEAHADFAAELERLLVLWQFEIIVSHYYESADA